MEETSQESNIQNNQKQIINPDNQIHTQQLQEDNNSSNQNEIINPQKNSSEVNSTKKPQLTKENKVSNINHNITQQEQNPLLIEEQSKDIHNLPQNNNIEYTSLQTAKNANQQITHNNNQSEINVYNINNFKNDIIINKLMSNSILPNIVLCQICKKQMKLEKAASYQDGIILRC